MACAARCDECRDDLTGDIIGRAADRRVVRNSGTVSCSNRVTNTAETRCMFTAWADQLRAFLDQHSIAS